MGGPLRKEIVKSMIRKATPQDVLDFAPNMRDADKQEVEALTGLDPLACLMLGLMHSDPCMAGVSNEGEIVMIFGINQLDPGVGAIWMLSSNAIKDHARELVREGKRWLDEQHALYPVLTNVVDERNDVHRRLIKHMGFSFGEPINNYGVAGVRVIPFERKG